MEEPGEVTTLVGGEVLATFEDFSFLLTYFLLSPEALKALLACVALLLSPHSSTNNTTIVYNLSCPFFPLHSHPLTHSLKNSFGGSSTLFAVEFIRDVVFAQEKLTPALMRLTHEPYHLSPEPLTVLGLCCLSSLSLQCIFQTSHT